MRRRDFLAAAGITGLVASQSWIKNAYGMPQLSRGRNNRSTDIETKNTANNVVFIMLEGGPSHVDTFDLKTDTSTPDILGAASVAGISWPVGIMPKLAERTQKFALLRSLTAVDPVHERAVYHLTTSHRHDASRVIEVPHIASVMSYHLEATRRPQDTLPSAVLFGQRMAGNGFFPIQHRGLDLNEAGRINDLVHSLPNKQDRIGLLNRLLDQVPSGDSRSERVNIQKQAQILMNDEELIDLLGPQDQAGQDEEVPGSAFMEQCTSVVRLLKADKGTRVIQMYLGGWDHHLGIYSPEGLPALATSLDSGLAYLIDELEKSPGSRGGSLLDETLIVAVGEFGRTPGSLNESAGRDHYPYAMSAFFAGGGVAGGRVIGATNSQGSTITDPGWSRSRYMSIGDLTATMYSALGIDWTQRFTNTPSGRLYEIVPTNLTGPVYHIDTLFA